MVKVYGGGGLFDYSVKQELDNTYCILQLIYNLLVKYGNGLGFQELGTNES